MVKHSFSYTTTDLSVKTEKILLGCITIVYKVFVQALILDGLKTVFSMIPIIAFSPSPEMLLAASHLCQVLGGLRVHQVYLANRVNLASLALPADRDMAVGQVVH